MSWPPPHPTLRPGRAQASTARRRSAVDVCYRPRNVGRCSSFRRCARRLIHRIDRWESLSASAPVLGRRFHTRPPRPVDAPRAPIHVEPTSWTLAGRLPLRVRRFGVRPAWTHASPVDPLWRPLVPLLLPSRLPAAPTSATRRFPRGVQCPEQAVDQSPADYS